MATRREVERRKVNLSHIEISAFCHATEDCLRVEESVRNVLPEEIRKIVKIEFTSREGYYGNPIRILSAKLNDKNQVGLVLKHLSSRLEPIEKTILKSTFDLRFDQREGRFVIRLSKQELVQDRFRVTDSDDVVKVVIYLANAKKKQDVLEFLKNAGLIT